jgi:hypothetical protein
VAQWVTREALNLVIKVGSPVTWADHKVVLSVVQVVWATKAREPADHKVVLSPVTWAEVQVKVWTVAILAVAAALVLETQARAAANADKAECSHWDCFAITSSSLVSLQGLIIW